MFSLYFPIVQLIITHANSRLLLVLCQLTSAAIALLLSFFTKHHIKLLTPYDSSKLNK